MATNYIGNGNFIATSAISANRLVSISPDRTVWACLTGKYPDGVTTTDVAAGDYVAIKFWNSGGDTKVSFTLGPVTCGDVVYAVASGQVGRSQGTITVGRALNTLTSAQTINGKAIVEILPGWSTAN
jgi:hypothetical protein